MAEGRKVVASNRKAKFQYKLEERLEAGLVLQGTEIKSIRAGKVSLNEAFVRVENDEAWLIGAHIAPYDPASSMNHIPTRPRKLLLHKRQIRKLRGKIEQRGYTIVPTQLYLVHGRAKVEIALARGKRKFDKRKELAERDAQRQVERALASRNRS